MTLRQNRPGTFDTDGDRATTTRAKRTYHRRPDSEVRRSWFQLRVGPGDLARIDALASALHLTRSEVARRAIERLAEDLGLAVRPKTDDGPTPQRLE